MILESQESLIAMVQKMNSNDGRVISNFIVQALNNKPITIYGDGSQTRSFCFIDDLIKALFLLMESNYKKPINIGIMMK